MVLSINHYKPTLIIRITSNLNDKSDKESFGFNNLIISTCFEGICPEYSIGAYKNHELVERNFNDITSKYLLYYNPNTEMIMNFNCLLLFD